MNREITITLDPEYKFLISLLKQKVISAHLRAALSVNIEQIKLYWEIGRTINEQMKKTQWGGKVLEYVARDLSSSFSEMKGFSRSNIHNMKQFFENYPDFTIVQQSVGQLPWGHIVLIIQRVKNPEAREWYVNKTLEHGWARNSLERQQVPETCDCKLSEALRAASLYEAVLLFRIINSMLFLKIHSR